MCKWKFYKIAVQYLARLSLAYRDFGVDANYVDAPLLSAKAKAESEIFAALKKYEPRVTVKQITWRSNVEGVLRAKVKVVINET